MMKKREYILWGGVVLSADGSTFASGHVLRFADGQGTLQPRKCLCAVFAEIRRGAALCASRARTFCPPVLEPGKIRKKQKKTPRISCFGIRGVLYAAGKSAQNFIAGRNRDKTSCKSNRRFRRAFWAPPLKSKGAPTQKFRQKNNC